MRRVNSYPKAPLDIGTALAMFCQWKDDHWARIGMTPSELFAGAGPFLDLNRVWFFGSTAWMPLMMGRKHDHQTDIDLVFVSEDEARQFAAHALTKLNGVKNRYYENLEPNRFGGPSIRHLVRKTPSSEIDPKVLDVAWLPPTRTVAEFVGSFPQIHERCAILASAQRADVHLVTRAAWTWDHRRSDAKHRKECYACEREYAEGERRSYSGGSS